MVMNVFSNLTPAAQMLHLFKHVQILQATIVQQQATIEQQQATIEQQQATIEQQQATIEQMQIQHTTEKQEMRATMQEMQVQLDVYDRIFFGQRPDVPVSCDQYCPFCPHCIGRHSSGECPPPLHRPIPRKHGV